jgi:hypothetical protein
MTQHCAVAGPDNVIKSVGVSFIEQAGLARQETEFPRRTGERVWTILRRSRWRTIVKLTVGPRTVAPRSTWRYPALARSIGPKRVAQFTDATAQFVVSAAKLFAPLEFVSRKPETGEDSEQEETVPELQPPADGLENHAQRSME